MNNLDPFRRLHAHRMWANRQLMAAAQAIDNEQLHRALAIGQATIWKSLLHLYAAEYVWLEALQGHEQFSIPGDRLDQLPGTQQAEGGIASLTGLRAKWNALDQRWQQYLDQLSPDDLRRDVAKVSANGLRTSTHLSDVLLHVCTHAHYTAAQVINMLRQVGVQDLPNPMLISLARQERSVAGG
ncbi:MAG TPA: DinB family protein [Pirellulales bacterium]|jgi:uncharacterized damage-inducible protein DinB|nr:DinB family protein [Pirellulales bacterium]